jgi:hypothetical protein
MAGSSRCSPGAIDQIQSAVSLVVQQS